MGGSAFHNLYQGSEVCLQDHIPVKRDALLMNEQRRRNGTQDYEKREHESRKFHLRFSQSSRPVRGDRLSQFCSGILSQLRVSRCELMGQHESEELLERLSSN